KPEIEFRYTRYARQVESWIERGAARRVNRRGIVRGERVGIEGQPVPEGWNLVREFESRCTFPRVIRCSVVHRRCKTEITVKESAKSKRASRTSEFGRSRKSKFKIWCRFETDFLAVKERARRKLIAGKLAKEKIDFSRT